MLSTELKVIKIICSLSVLFVHKSITNVLVYVNIKLFSIVYAHLFRFATECVVSSFGLIWLTHVCGYTLCIQFSHVFINCVNRKKTIKQTCCHIIVPIFPVTWVWLCTVNYFCVANSDLQRGDFAFETQTIHLCKSTLLSIQFPLVCTFRWYKNDRK